MHRTFPKAPLPTFMGGAKRLSLRQPMAARLTALPVVRITAPAPGHLAASFVTVRSREQRWVAAPLTARQSNSAATHTAPLQPKCHPIKVWTCNAVTWSRRRHARTRVSWILLRSCVDPRRRASAAQQR